MPTIVVRTPYNFNFWDVRNGVPRDMTAALTAVKRGYAYVDRTSAGTSSPKGNYDILGAAAHRRRRRAELDCEAAVVERQGRDDRLLVDGGVADGASRRSGTRRSPR